MRELIAEQLYDLAKILNADTVLKIIIPVCINLCEDPVSNVRRKAAKRMALILLDNQKNESIYSYLLKVMLNYSVSPRFNISANCSWFLCTFPKFDRRWYALVI